MKKIPPGTSKNVQIGQSYIFFLMAKIQNLVRSTGYHLYDFFKVEEWPAYKGMLTFKNSVNEIYSETL